VSSNTYRAFYNDSEGFRLYSYDVIEGNSWKGSGIQEVKGKSYKTRTELLLAPDGKTFTYQWYYSEDGTNWKSILKGSGKKVEGH
jgi:hypothetical protein